MAIPNTRHEEPSEDERTTRFSRVRRSLNGRRSVDGLARGATENSTGNNDLDDSQYVEPASTEMYSGPASESVPSSYSSFHMFDHANSGGRRLSRSRSAHRNSEYARNSFSRNSFAEDIGRSLSQSQNSQSQLSSSVISVESLNQQAQNSYLKRDRSESRSSFRFFSWDEIEHAQGATTAGDDIDPVAYDSLSEDIAQLIGSEDDIDGEERGREGNVALSPILHHGHHHRKKSGADDDQIDSDAHSQRGHISRRRSSHFYEDVGADEPLLVTESLDGREQKEAADHIVYTNSERLFQRYYITEEDLVIGFAGFKTSRIRSFFYAILSIGTLGIAYLILRWFPRLRIQCIGKPCALGQCDWVVVENQWGELTIVNVNHQRYDQRLSTIFRTDSEKSELAANDSDSSTVDASDDNVVVFEDEEDYYVDSDPLVPSLRWIEYRYIKFIYHPFKDIYLTNNNWIDPNWNDVESVSEGLDSDVQTDRSLVFGDNLIDIKEKTTTQLLVDEVLHPFYVFQVFSMILWAFDEYYYYASCIFFISVISVGNTLIETKQALARLRNISKFVCDVRVLRSGFWTTIPSSELVPGDVYEVSDPTISSLPCDSILLSGDCIVNESMLTGESVPVSKVPITDSSLQGMVAGNSPNGGDDLAKHYLYSGTKIIRVRRPKRPRQQAQGEDYDVALAVVIRTGFSTTKGSLVRSMLFPKPSGFKFYEDSFKYIGVMAMIACVGFIVCTVNFIRMNLPTHLIVFRALDMITIVVPPALPATLTIGTNISLARLRQKSIFCISPNRVNVGGKLDVVCFDKTGTLTEDGLDVLGIHLLAKEKFSPLYSSLASSQGPESLEMTNALTTCHSLRSVDDELIGDPLDAKMFDFSGWQFKEEEGHGAHSRVSISPDGKTVLTALKTFEFISQLRRMSVLAKRQDGSLSIYCKGAPEVMDQVCDRDSFPVDYQELLHQYTHRGYRVIAVAGKKIRIEDDSNIDVATADIVANLRREDAERELQFIGFIIFENKLKPTTARVIQKLEEAKIRTIMCTGDNVLTAISVARECYMIPDKTVVFAPHFVEQTQSEEYSTLPIQEEVTLRWESIDDPTIVLNAQMRPLDQTMRNYSLAVTGDVFRYIVKNGSDEQLEQMLIKGSIFARMSPDEKHELVERLQQIGYTTGFCGDGANDCGALKAADVGISLSEAEASVAAPFTSRKFEIDCVLDVIGEGRCALATSFSCFKYMSLYSAIQFVSVSILYGFGSNLGDFQFLWIDLFLILPIAIFMAWSKPFPVLSRKRPTANLVSRKVLVPLVGEIVILATFQIIIWMFARDQPWYIPPKIGGEDSEVASTDNTALFMTSCFQYIFTAIVLSVGPPYREPLYKNYPFLITVGVAVALSISLLFVDPDGWFGNLMTLSYTPLSFKGILVAFATVNFLASWIADRAIFPVIARCLMNLRKSFGYVKTRKRYKVLNDQLKEPIV
ncbi:Ypk9p [Sugiyamaella lignohabitans]|uniref:Cation-transporting ATPase n=1 Tax=Sugiyamaella lignohabitans TaxID=796027 RepID=A0A167ELY3_9ASCO|nr:Ypk9p [Sugiyamaella lignohabitans]ANB14233.1 Ypk9p [Sugiyamaella lignohabitans]